jgi:hypothetical protein
MLCLQNYQKLGILSFLFAGGILKGKFHVFFNREGVAIEILSVWKEVVFKSRKNEKIWVSRLQHV